MKIHYDIIQGTDEWFKLKELKLSASHATAIGANGKGLITNVNDKVLNLINPAEHFTNKDMERGNELEPIARAKYEFERMVNVIEVGFIERCEYSGISPDGLVDQDPEGPGGIEIKARNNAKHFALLRGGPIESSTRNQIQFSLLISKRKWWDFVSYNPNFKQSIEIRRLYPDLAYHEKLEIGLENGIKMLKELLDDPIVKQELC